MTALDLGPRPGAAPLPTMVLRQAAMEARLLVRNGEQLLLALVIPALVLVAGTEADRVVDLGAARPIDVVAPGVLALAVMSTSFTSLAISTGFERRYGVLKRLGASPLPRLGLLAGKAGAVLAVQVVQLAVLIVLGLLLGWRPDGGAAGWAWTLVLAVLGTAAFGSLGLLLAGVLRAEATLAVANLVHVLLLVGGGVVVPADRLPAAIEPVAALLPSGALGEGMRAALDTGAVGAAPIVLLLLWTVAAAAAVTRTFRWES